MVVSTPTVRVGLRLLGATEREVLRAATLARSAALEDLREALALTRIEADVLPDALRGPLPVTGWFCTECAGHWDGHLECPIHVDAPGYPDCSPH